MRIFVTGGAGFIGSHLVDRLLEQGHAVTVLDNFDPYYDPRCKHANLEQAARWGEFALHQGDVRDRSAVLDLIGGIRPEAVIHMAACAGVRPSIEDPSRYAEVNVQGTLNVLDGVRALEDRPRVVLASSSSVYGQRGEGPFHEDDRIDRPASPYAASKAAAEAFGWTYHQVYQVPMTCLRFFTAYGPRNRPDLALCKFARQIVSGQPVTMYGDGSTQRDYTYVGDIVEGIVGALARDSGFRIYNLGNGTPVTLRTMIATLGEALGIAPQIQRLPEQTGDVRMTHADIRRAQEELGYQPTTSLDDGFARFVEWFVGSPLDPRSSTALASGSASDNGHAREPTSRSAPDPSDPTSTDRSPTS